MADYSIKFWTLAEETGWGQQALISTLLNNISDELKDELVMRDLPASLDSVISLFVKVDECLWVRRGTRNDSSHEPLGHVEMATSRGAVSGSGCWEMEDEENGEQTMQLGHSRSSPEESHCHHMSVTAKDRARQ